MRKIFSLVFVFIAIFTLVQPVEACDPTPPSPEYVDCNDLGSGYKFGFRVKYAPNGKFRFTSSYGTLTGGAPSDPNNYVQIYNSNGYVFDWQASLGIDAVIVNAGGKSRVIKDAEDDDGHKYYGKTDSRGRPYKISSVEFCYDYELSVSKTATGVAATGSAWEITKGVAVPSIAKFAGETASFDYTVDVRKVSSGESGYSVRGEVVVTNNTPLKAYIVEIKDYLKPGDIKVSLDCGVSFPYKLYPGKTLTCTYNRSLGGKLEGKNTVKVYTKYDVGGGYAEDSIEWTTESGGGTGPSQVTVTDTQAAFGGPFTISDSATWTYAVQATCPGDPALYTDGKLTTVVDNTAAIVETNQSASAQAVLDCYLPSITQANTTSLDVKYNWGIQKVGSVDDLILSLNETRPVDYTVTLSVLNAIETNHKLAGTVTLTNPHPTAALTGVLAAEPAPGTPATLTDCTSEVTIPAGGSVTCSYEAPLTASLPGTTNASFAFNSLSVVNTKDYSFDAATRSEVDECVTVLDDKYGPLGEVCATEAPKVFTYTMEVGGLTVCEAVPFTNVATFTTNDTQTPGSASWMVYLQVDCETDKCLNTMDYWIEHSFAGNYDSTWDKVQPSGPTSPFFGTGSTWVETLQRTPQMNADPRANMYLALSRDYITAKLNQLQGSQIPAEIITAMASAEVLLDEYDNGTSSISDETFAEMEALFEMLNNYNNGGLGQEVCCY